MSIAIAITVTQSKFTASTLPSPTGNRTMAAADGAIAELAERTRKYVETMFNQIDPAAAANTTVAVTVT